MVFADRSVLWLCLGDVDRRAISYEFIEFTSGILVKTQAAVGARNRPYGADVEAIGRVKAHPILHGKSDVAVSWARALRALGGYDRIPLNPHSVGVRALVFDFFDDAEVAFWSRGFRFANRCRCDEKRLVAFHHIDHSVMKRDFDLNVGGILGLVSNGVVMLVGSLGRLAGRQRKS